MAKTIQSTKAKNSSDSDLEDLFSMEEISDCGANLQLPNPGLVSYYKDIRSKYRMLYITRDIDDSLMEEIRHIIRWNMEDEMNGIPIEERVPIKILILSYGGALDMCFSILDIMRLSKTKIITVNLGVAASAACMIYLCGHERYMLRNSWCLLHQGSGGASGTYGQAEAQMENYKKLVKRMEEIILKSSKIDPKVYNRKKSKEWYIYAEESIDLGITDHIVENISDLYKLK